MDPANVDPLKEPLCEDKTLRKIDVKRLKPLIEKSKKERNERTKKRQLSAVEEHNRVLAVKRDQRTRLLKYYMAMIGRDRVEKLLADAYAVIQDNRRVEVHIVEEKVPQEYTTDELEEYYYDGEASYQAFDNIDRHVFLETPLNELDVHLDQFNLTEEQRHLSIMTMLKRILPEDFVVYRLPKSYGSIRTLKSMYLYRIVAYDRPHACESYCLMFESMLRTLCIF